MFNARLIIYSNSSKITITFTQLITITPNLLSLPFGHQFLVSQNATCVDLVQTALKGVLDSVDADQIAPFGVRVHTGCHSDLKYVFGILE